jgi:hypothetical protein
LELKEETTAAPVLFAGELMTTQSVKLDREGEAFVASFVEEEDEAV